MNNIFIKIKIFFMCVKEVKNWWIPVLMFFGLSNEKKLVEFKNGLKCFMRDKSDAIAFFEIFFLNTNFPSKSFLIQESDTVIDVGAHVGYFTLYAARLATTGRIFSFEPNKESFHLLEENIKLNNFTNVNAVNSGVSDKTGKAELFLSKDSSIGNSMYLKDSTEKETIQVMSLSDIIKNYNIDFINFLKLDCEGAEFDIILNLPLEIFKKIHKISAEVHPYLVHKKINDFTNFVIKNRFNVQTHSINVKENLHMLYAINRE